MSNPQKAFSFSGALPPDKGLPLDPAGALSPEPRYRLTLSAHHGQGPSTILSKFTHMHTSSPEVQQLWAQRQSLEMRTGLLYRRYIRIRPDGSQQYWQVVVPSSLRTATGTQALNM